MKAKTLGPRSADHSTVDEKRGTGYDRSIPHCLRTAPTEPGFSVALGMESLSIIIPCLNEQALIGDLLTGLQPLRGRGVEIVLVDGGSTDATVAVARPLVDRLVNAPRGRAAQMSAGAGAARGEVLLFLHADSMLPSDADRVIARGLQASGRRWGRFDVSIRGRHPMLSVIARMMNLRSRLTGIATGDQGIFVTRELWVQCGGFSSIRLMEDVALSKRLKAHARPLCIGHRLVTSGRRWEQHGVWRTILLMWWLRLCYFCGADPERLATLYDHDRSARPRPGQSEPTAQ